MSQLGTLPEIYIENFYFFNNPLNINQTKMTTNIEFVASAPNYQITLLVIARGHFLFLGIFGIKLYTQVIWVLVNGLVVENF